MTSPHCRTPRMQLASNARRLYGLNLCRGLGDKFLKDEDLGAPGRGSRGCRAGAGVVEGLRGACIGSRERCWVAQPRQASPPAAASSGRHDVMFIVLLGPACPPLLPLACRPVCGAY